MQTIHAESIPTKYTLLCSERVGVCCDACSWTGRRVLRIITSFANRPFDPLPEGEEAFRARQGREIQTAMRQAREMRFHPSCPRCGGDVYHR